MDGLTTICSKSDAFSRDFEEYSHGDLMATILHDKLQEKHSQLDYISSTYTNQE